MRINIHVAFRTLLICETWTIVDYEVARAVKEFVGNKGIAVEEEKERKGVILG